MSRVAAVVALLLIGMSATACTTRPEVSGCRAYACGEEAGHATGVAVALETHSPTLHREFATLLSGSGMVVYGGGNADLVLDTRYAVGEGRSGPATVRIFVTLKDAHTGEVLYRDSPVMAGVCLPPTRQGRLDALTVALKSILRKHSGEYRHVFRKYASY